MRRILFWTAAFFAGVSGSAQAQTGPDDPPATDTAPPDTAPTDATATGAMATDAQTDASEQLSAEEMAELEAALGADASEQAEAMPRATAAGVQSLNPDISFITDVALAVFSTDDNLQAGAHDPSTTGFRLQQLELALGKSVDPYFRVDGNIVFSNEEGVDVEEIYATTLALPYALQARFGQFLTSFGRLNSTHPHSWDFVDQPFMLSKIFGGENNRGVGAELSWLTPLPWYVEVVGAVNNATGDETSRSFYGDTDLGVDSPLDLQYTGALKQFFDVSDDWSLLWGLSVATGPNATGPDKRSNLFGTDFYLKYRPITRASHTMVSLQAEYVLRRRQVPDNLLQDHGGYVYLYWHFAQRWATGLRYEYGAPATTRDGESGSDDLDPEWVSNRHRVTANATFYPSEFSRIRVQGSVDDPTWRDEKIYAAMIALEFNIGAHGAHAF